MNKPMNKTTLMYRLEQLRTMTEENEIQPVYKDAVIDTLLDYIRDPDVRAKVEAIVL